MKHAFIVPTSLVTHPEIGMKTDFILALSHLIDLDLTTDYAKAIVARKEQTGGTIVLDNGLFENHVPESGKNLWLKAHKLGAATVFAPDHLYDCTKTREAFEEFVQVGKELEAELGITLPKPSYVVQANHYEDYIQEFKAACKYDIEMIGLSILSIPESFKHYTKTDNISINRAIAIAMLDQLDCHKKPCHLLGLGDSLADIWAANATTRCVSNDSSVPFWSAMMDASTYNEDGVLSNGKTKEKVDFDRVYNETRDIPFADMVAMFDHNLEAIAKII